MSANGIKIEVSRSNGKTFTIRAAWAAPFFVLFDDVASLRAGEIDTGPHLYHAESLESAQGMASCDPNNSGQILDAKFNPVGRPVIKVS